jgi:acyl phosphate:glycerol-3-phosphate acyltransferase
MWLNLISVIIGYLLGSFPAGYIIARYKKGIDIREVGVRNMGGANVVREVGFWPGVLTLIFDIGKGTLSIFIAQWLGLSLPWILATGFAAMLGHNYPVFLGFRGGKGIATVMGIFFVLSPLAALITGVLIGIGILITRSVFVAIEMASPFFPLLIWYFEGIGAIFYFTIAVVVFQLFRSRGRLKEIKPVFTRLTQLSKKVF